ncbi:MAG: caspase family protein [Bacteroidia bacterium]|nr:caspase family protein [Bacteroidia bacterium]
MKKYIIFIILSLFVAQLAAQSENTFTGFVKIEGKTRYEHFATKPVSIINRKLIDQKTQQIVSAKVQNWMVRKPTEAKDLYLRRVSPANRRRVAQHWTQEKINEFGTKIIDLRLTGYEYDTENEVCKLEIAGVKPIYIEIPNRNGEVELLIDNLDKIELVKPQFTLSQDSEFALLYLELNNTMNGYRYLYDSERELNFKKEVINIETETYDVTGFYKDVRPDLEETDVVNEKQIDVDLKIPNGSGKNPNTYALIIGNEDYSGSSKYGNTEFNVPYAENDAAIFKNYCEKTLNIPSNQITYLINATYTEMKRAIFKLQAMPSGANVIVYYAGHGLPDPGTRDPYLIPVDGDGSNLQEFGIPLNSLYDNLSKPSVGRSVVFLDACFSGAARNKSLLEGTGARGVKIPQEISLSSFGGNTVVFSASSNSQQALPSTGNDHGIFTFHLLKKLRETKGEITLGQLRDYLKEEVNKEAISKHSRPQKPEVQVTEMVQAAWKDWTLFERP